MAVKSVQDLMTNLNTILGERDDDEALEFMQDLSDTFNDMSSHKGDYTQEQYDELDSKWRKRYRERFFSGTANTDDESGATDDSNDGNEDRSTSVQIRDLFSIK